MFSKAIGTLDMLNVRGLSKKKSIESVSMILISLKHMDSKLNGLHRLIIQGNV